MASLSKQEAETRKLVAETSRIEREQARLDELHLLEVEQKNAENRKLNAEAEDAEITLEATRDEELSRRADNFHHRVYRFVTGVSDSTVAACISQLDRWHRIEPGCTIEIIFTSPGGDVIAGLSLVDHIRILRSNGHKVIAGSEGMAASMAGILIQAGDVRWVGRESWLLFHEVSFGAFGSTSEVEDRVEWSKRVQERVINMLCDRAKTAVGETNALTPTQFRAKWKKKDWFLDSDEALKLGFVDEVR